MEAIIQAKDLYKTYMMGKLTIEVLKNVNLLVRSGEFISIMGPSGSGKSTLLYLIGGLDKPTSGKIVIKGRDLSTMNDRDSSIMRRRDVGFIFQFYNLIPNLNVEENILLPVLLDNKKLKPYIKMMENILKTVEFEGRRLHTPRELSAGEQQRVALARALISDPDIILADEPTGSLDTRTGTEVITLLQKINREQGKTIIMVTHSNEAARYAGRTIHLKDGIIFGL
ncbi:putative ABC transporter ATP-binding protein YknY [subsurface metagenome]